jgi:putative hydrolase of HD superfamily
VTLDALVEAARLKRLARAGWVRVGVSSPESVAAHSWGVAMLVVNLAPPGIDLGRALTYAVLHDLAEVRVGDLMPSDGVSHAEKARREREAMVGLAPELLDRYDRYEAQEDDESRFVRQCDRLDMAIQALAYARDGAAGMREFVESAAKVVNHPSLRPLLDAIFAELAALGQ